MTFIVPAIVQRAAQKGLDAHSDPEGKLPGVAGFSMAEALASGHVTLDVVAKLHRFFAVNAKPYLEEVQSFKTLQDSALIQSWYLHGSASGRAWSDRVFKESVEQGIIPADPVTELMTLRPEGVYNRFALGAWRYEYDLNPRKAARFTENYMRATGWPLDLRQAFGQSAEAVGNAVYRRYHTPNPFRTLYRAMMAEDVEYRIAASRDLAFLKRNTPPDDKLVLEAFKKYVFTGMNPKQAAKLVWAPFVAYFILATEAPDIVKEYNELSAKPPKYGQNPLSWLSYNDTINTCISYFHPDGGRYVSSAGDPKFSGVEAEVISLVWKAYYGKNIPPPFAKKLLGSARRWTAQNKLAGNLFHIFIADWKKGNWQHILENIPRDADVRPYFEQFVKGNPIPKDGIKLQQTLAKKSEKAKVAKYLSGPAWKNSKTTPVKSTKAAFVALGKKTPLGVYSIITLAGVDYVYLGAWKNASGTVVHMVENPQGKVVGILDHNFTSDLTGGTTVVKQAHKDMPGTLYGQTVVAPAAVQEPVTTQEGEIDELLAADFPNHYTTFEKASFNDTDSSMAAYNRFSGHLSEGMTLTDKNGDVFVFLAVYTTPEGLIIIIRNPDGELIWQDDGDFADIISEGNIKLSGWKDPNVLNVASQTPEIAGTPTTATEGGPPMKFEIGTIVKRQGLGNYLVLGFDDGMYQLLRLHASATGCNVETQLKESIEDSGVDIATHVDGTMTGEKYVTIPNWTTASAISLPPGFSAGGPVALGDKDYTLVSAFDTDDGKVVLAYAFDTITLSGNTITYPNYYVIDYASIGKPVTSSYEPEGPRPERGAEDALDSEAGPSKMSGTPEALQFIAKKGFVPLTKGDSPIFMFDLGGKLAYGHAKTRTIIGYARQPDGDSPKHYYIIMTEKGNINFKQALSGNMAYGPMIEILQDVVDELLPAPGKEVVAFPKLNYALSSTAKKVALEDKLIYVPSPDDAPFPVGAKLVYKPATEPQKIKLIAWVDQTKMGEPTGEKLAVLRHKDDDATYLVEVEDLANSYTIAFKHSADMNSVTGEMVFSKMNGQGLTLKTPYDANIGAGVPLPYGWDDPDPVEQPPMAKLPTGGHISAGIIAVMPPLAMMSDGESMAPAPSTLFLLVNPMNDYGGYTLTYPKGTVDKGESLEQTAVREVYEETGLAVKPVGYLGDFKGNDSVTRFFIGYITGGDPLKAGSETDAVTFKPVPLSYQKLPWYGELHKRDQLVTDATVKWLLDKGWPHLFTGEKADAYSQVTGPQDVEGQTGVVAFNPNDMHTIAATGTDQQASIVDYAVPAGAVAWVSASLSLPDAKTWAWIPALSMLDQGYPPPGVKVTVKIEKLQQTVIGYMRYVTTGGFVTTAIVMQSGTDFDWRTLYWQMEAEGPTGKKEYATKAKDFYPVVSPVMAKTKTIPADTSKADIWRALLFKCPYPVNEEMLTVLKDVVAEEGYAPAAFNCSRQHASVPGVSFGDVFLLHGAPLVCLGYLAVTDTMKKQHKLMFSQNKAGQYIVLSATDTAMGAYLPVSGDEGFGNPDAWFTHPDPKTNKLIQQLYANGGNLKAVGTNMTTFSTAWMKKVKFPAWSIMTKIVVQDVASLFIPGAATKPVYEAVIGMLKARMKASHKGKNKLAKKTKAPVGAPPTATGMVQKSYAAVPAWKPVIAPVVKIGTAKIAFDSPAILQQVSAPEPGLFKDTGGTISGGSNPCAVLSSPGGFQWFFKTPKDQAEVRVHVEVAAFKLAQLVDKTPTVPVGKMEFNGKLGSFQPLLEGSPPESDPNDLPDEDKGEILTQHMLDMFMGDHDGHRGNWMRLKAGRLVPVDRGQAFKFVLKGLTESLDPHWHPKGNVGEGYAKKLLNDWGASTAEIPELAWKAAREMIEKIRKLTEKHIQGLLAPIFASEDITGAKRTKILDTLYKRQKNYLKDWTKVLKKLQSDFKWPKIGKIKMSMKAPRLRIDPKTLGFGKAQAEDIAIASAYPIRGRAMKVDRDSIEQQEVMVKAVMWEKSPGKKVPATLIHFRMARHAGMLAVPKLLKQSGVIKQVTGSGGPHLLAVDSQNGFWSKIQAAIKSINYHLAPEEDGGGANQDMAVNEKTMAACFAIKPDLIAIIKATGKTAGTYGPMDEPNAIVNSMAGMYLEYLTLYIEPIMADLLAHKGKHTPKLGEFLWQAPEVDESDEQPDVPKAFDVKGNSHAKWPKVVQEADGTLLLQHDSHDVYAGANQDQFVIVAKALGAKLFVNSTGMDSNLPGLQTGVKGHQGQSWGYIEGTASAATIATLFTLFAQATGIDMSVATEKDKEILFWSKQAYLNQSGGEIKPKSDGTGVVTPEYTTAMELYRKGADDLALSALQKQTAKALGISVTKAKAEAKPLLAGRYDEGSVGYMRHERLGWDRAKLEKLFGKHFYVGHGLNSTTKSYIKSLGELPILMAHNVRSFWGAGNTGASVESDYGYGGTQGVFLGFRKAATKQDHVLYFDKSLALRTDCVVVGRGDEFGSDVKERLMTPEQWKRDFDEGYGSSSGALNTMSRYQVNVRHGINLLDYLYRATCANQSDIDAILDMCAERGWTAFGPQKQPPEKVFVLVGKEKL
jgi:ADP-ribose pyrophosphatase YjhB (NUDIX family)